MLLPVCIQMALPVLRRNTLPLESRSIVLDIRQEFVETAEHALEMQNEVRALLVRDGAVRVVRVLSSFEVDDKALVFWPVLVLLERILEGFGADEEGESAIGWCMEELKEETFDVGRPTFVQPKVGGVRLTWKGIR